MDVRIEMPHGSRGILSVGMEHQPGSPPPKGYTDWHEWADVQHKAGLRQRQCSRCTEWNFPQELSAEVCRYEAFDSRGNTHVIESPVCLKCATDKTGSM